MPWCHHLHKILSIRKLWTIKNKMANKCNFNKMASPIFSPCAKSWPCFEPRSRTFYTSTTATYTLQTNKNKMSLPPRFGQKIQRAKVTLVMFSVCCWNAEVFQWLDIIINHRNPLHYSCKCIILNLSLSCAKCNWKLKFPQQWNVQSIDFFVVFIFFITIRIKNQITFWM